MATLPSGTQLCSLGQEWLLEPAVGQRALQRGWDMLGGQRSVLLFPASAPSTPAQEGREGKGCHGGRGSQATSLPVESMTEAVGPGASAFPLGNRAGAFHSLLRRQRALRDGAVAQDRGSWACGSELHLVRPGSS